MLPQFSRLPIPFIVEDLTLLEEHIPMPATPNTKGILAALIAYQAVAADEHRIQRDKNNTHSIDWMWYIKEIARRKFTYRQITDVLCAMCSLLELSTDAAVFLYCSHPERSREDRTVGRDERIYSNHRGRTSQIGEPLYNGVLNAARLFGDSLTLDWATRQNTYNSAAFRGTVRCARSDLPIHRFGDFPRPTRVDGDVADELVNAICHLDWASLGITPPHCVGRLASFPGMPLLERSPSAEPRSYRSAISGFSSISIPLEDGNGEDASSAADGIDASFTGRRTNESELTFMDSLGLEELQKVKIRLALWEVHPRDWYPAFCSILHDNYRAVYRLLGVFVDGQA